MDMQQVYERIAACERALHAKFDDVYGVDDVNEAIAHSAINLLENAPKYARLSKSYLIQYVGGILDNHTSKGMHRITTHYDNGWQDKESDEDGMALSGPGPHAVSATDAATWHGNETVMPQSFAIPGGVRGRAYHKPKRAFTAYDARKAMTCRGVKHTCEVRTYSEPGELQPEPRRLTPFMAFWRPGSIFKRQEIYDPKANSSLYARQSIKCKPPRKRCPRIEACLDIEDNLNSGNSHAGVVLRQGLLKISKPVRKKSKKSKKKAFKRSMPEVTTNTCTFYKGEIERDARPHGGHVTYFDGEHGVLLERDETGVVALRPGEWMDGDIIGWQHVDNGGPWVAQPTASGVRWRAVKGREREFNGIAWRPWGPHTQVSYEKIGVVAGS